MYRLVIMSLAVSPLCAEVPLASERPGEVELAPPQWSVLGNQWHVTVKQDARAWGKGYSNPKTAERAQIPRVAYEYDLTIRVVGVEESDTRRLVRLEFIPGADAPKHSIGGHRYTLTLDVHTLRVVEAEYTKRNGERVTTGKMTPSTVQTEADMHKALFARAYGFPVDWVIEGDDMDRTGVECFLARRPSEVGAKGRWEGVDPANLDQETPHMYQREFRRTVTPTEDGEAIKVRVFQRDAFRETPSYEIEQVWDPKVGWWRSFTRRIQGHLDLEATLITDKP